MKNATKNSNKHLSLVCVLIFLLFGCANSPSSSDNESPNNKAITAFSFLAEDNPELSADVTATINETDIAATVPYGTDVSALIATFTTTGESVTVGSTMQVSGTTDNDFSSAVTYRVTAADWSTLDYTVTVTVASGVAGDSANYTADSVSFDMVYVPGGLTFPTGIDDETVDVITNAYLIGQTEVTYKLWYTVRVWAENTASPSYTFANKGREGDDGTDDAAPTTADQEPVTYINWRDAMVWTNALTEYYNAQNGTSLIPVYTYNSSIIRVSQDTTDDTTCDNALASSTAKGFRLLTSNEWELAARYITDDGDNVLDQLGEYYPGDFASGADADYNNTATYDFDGDGDTQSSDDVAYSGLETALVKSKSPNALGLYDMSGNVWELTFSLSGNYRVGRGGSWSGTVYGLQVGFGTYSSGPFSEDHNTGFRFARAP